MMALGIFTAAAILVVAVMIRSRHKEEKLLKHLDRMLDQAMERGFTQADYDERLLSSVEAKLSRYLAASTVSARNLQSEKEKIQALVADISHQTKTPISNILLYTQLLSERSLPEEARTCVTALEAQTEKLKSLIEALVKTSRLETGVLALHPCPVPLAPLLEKAVAQFEPRAAKKGVALTLGTVDGVVVCDAKWTEEAVCCLIDNAVKYTPPGGEVSLDTDCYELFCRINVADTGCGIPEQERSKVFQRFYRCAASHSVQGVGIGLYLVRQIAQGQGGYVKLRPGAQGGSIFSLYLPRA